MTLSSTVNVNIPRHRSDPPGWFFVYAVFRGGGGELEGPGRAPAPPIYTALAGSESGAPKHYEL